MAKSLHERIEDALNVRKDNNSLRSLHVKNDLIDFASNDYLGLAQSINVKNRIKEYLNRNNYRNGSTGSRLISGTSEFALETELFLKQVFKEESLLFNSGYNANIGVLSCIPQKGDTILYDASSHASIKDGIRLSFADKFPFKHNNIQDLESKLKKAKGTVFIITESVFSMDGDTCPISEIIALSKKYNAYIIIDEAHSTGNFGNNGAGFVIENKAEKDIFIRVHTFGKAIGSHGACVVTNKNVKDYLINFSRSFIYTTAMPDHTVASIRSAFDEIQENPSSTKELNANISYFMESDIPHISKNPSPIQYILTPGNDFAKEKELKLKQKGLYCKAILSPTVKKGEERLRICLHNYNKKEEIDLLLREIKN